MLNRSHVRTKSQTRRDSTGDRLNQAPSPSRRHKSADPPLTWYQGSSALSNKCSRSVPKLRGFSRCFRRASPVDGRLEHNTTILPPT